MTTKKLGLLLLPFVPLTAIGIVEVAGSIMPAKPAPVADCQLPAVERLTDAPVKRFADPPPTPEPPAMPRAVVST